MKDMDNMLNKGFESELKKDSFKTESGDLGKSSNMGDDCNSSWHVTPEEVAAALATLEQYLPGDATEADRKNFGELQGVSLVDTTPEQRKNMLLSGRRVLREQMKDLKDEEKTASSAAAKSAEKVLFLSDSKWHRWSAAEDLIVAHSKYGLTKITKSSQKRTLESLLGYVPETVSKLRSRKDSLTEIGSSGMRAFGLLLALLAVAAIVLLQVHPTLIALFTEDNVYQALLVIGSIATIIMFFVGGFWGAGIFLVVYALVLGGLQMIIPLAILGKLLVLLVVALIAFFGLRTFFKENKKLSASVRKRRAQEIDALRADAAKLRRYVDTLAKQVDDFLKEDEAGAADRDEESKQHHYEIRVYIRQYRDKIKSAVSDLEKSIP